jgi:hypothetical protein
MSRCGDRISDYFDACSDLDLAPPKLVSLCSPHSKNDSACCEEHLADFGMPKSLRNSTPQLKTLL